MKYLQKAIVALLSITLFSPLLPSGASCYYPPDKQIKVFFRFDDFSARSSTVLEQKLIEAFRRRRFPFTVAVIPYICDRDYLDTGKQGLMALPPNKVKILRDALKAATLEVALHGYSHQTIRKRQDGPLTEFSGLVYQKQESKIQKGKQFLEETVQTKIVTFVPPFNSYDLNTIRVLEKQGFKCLSAIRSGKVKDPSSLRYLPITTELDGVRDAVEAAESMEGAQPVIGVMFHEYDFVEVDRTRGKVSFQEFERLLDWLVARAGIKVMTVRQISEVLNDAGPRRYLDNSSYYKVSQLMPVLADKQMKVYLPSATAIAQKSRAIVLIAIFLLVITFVSGGFCYWIGVVAFTRQRLLLYAAIFAASLFLFITVLYALNIKDIGYRGIILLAGLLGGGLGCGSAYVKTENVRKR